MHENRLVTGLAGAFALMTAVLAVGAIFAPPLLLPAALFAAVTYFIYYQASGRLLNRVYRSVEQQAATGSDPGRGGFGAGPREEWTPPREEQRRRVRGQRQRVRQEARQRQAGRAGQPRQSGPTPREASQVLGVAVDADEGTVRRAYRERIKEVHPDADGGDEEAFKRVQRAYEVLTD